MKTHTVTKTVIANVGAALCMLPALAQAGKAEQGASAAEVAALRADLAALRAELDALKKGRAEAAPVPAPAPAPNAAPAAVTAALAERVDRIEAQAKDAVVKGDLPDSFRLPGSKTSLRIYGSAELNMVHEMKGDNGDVDLAAYVPYAPLSGTAAARRDHQTYLHARTSRIGLEASTPTAFGPLGIRIEGDFVNDPRTGSSAVSGTVANIYTRQATNSYGFRLREAYGQVGGLLAGQTWSTFMDVDNFPETVDFNGPIGATYVRQAQLRYSRAAGDAGTFSVAVENPVSYVIEPVSGQPTVAGASRVPDLVARWDRQFGWGALSARAVATEHRIDDGAAQSAQRRGWGAALSGQVRVTDLDAVTFGVTGGNGIGRYFNYIEGAVYDAANNRILLERAAGAYLGYQHRVSDALRFNAAFGYQRNYDNAYTDFVRASGLDGGRFGVNRRVTQGHLNVFWDPVQNVEFGAEYLFGRRVTLTGEHGDMSRVNLLARYRFN